MEIPKAYNPKDYEDRIYKEWEKGGFFNPDNLKGEPFSVMVPPPNVTGVLHLGHAYEDTLMDVMVRYQRLQGKKVLLLPGTDHAAVATQAKVEKVLIESGEYQNPRDELGREKLLEKIREYAESSKGTIIKQMKKMGLSADWSRLAYTFDSIRSKAVNTVFEKMYNDGLIYRGYRVVNWSVKGQSTCSDDELEYVDRKAKLYTFKYSKDFPFTIATTRPETKLGDTAVAVNPNDKRYKDYLGKEFEVDFCGNKLKLKIIDSLEVDPEFGTGALGVTPAHSPVDFQMYEEQKAKQDPIDLIPVIGPDGKMTEQAGKEFVGLTVEEARAKVVTKLKAQGLFISEEEIDQSVGTSDRFKDVVEAIPMTQWFIDVNKEFKEKSGKGKVTLKQLMKEAVTTGHKGDKKLKVNISPDRFTKLYLQWIDNLRDWCISRQVWWGHRIPVWYCQDCQEKIVGNQGQTEVVILRHGQAVKNERKICSSTFGKDYDVLTDDGRKQIKELAKKFKNVGFDNIISSDFNRTKQTAEIVGRELGLEVKFDKRLRECGVGDWEGKDAYAFDEFRDKNFEKWEEANPDGIESFVSIKTRVFNFLDEVKKEYKGKKVLVVTHGDVPRVAKGYNTKLSNREIYDLGYPKLAHTETINLSALQCNCGSTNLVQDEDTLDTWFSSGLWTFSTLGWPEETDDLKTFHPTSWMQMGYEILFFWMARMILMTTYNLDTIPFYECYIHGILRDEKGQKFSKSLGNGIDPIEAADKFGTDALRWGLIAGTSAGNDSRFYEEKIESSRNMVNKLWNISRYILENSDIRIESKVKAETIADKWILSKLNQLIEEVTTYFDKYEFAQAGEIIREFAWNELADWYLEVAKVEKDKDEVLVYILQGLLQLWHPFLPFVTTAIWQEAGFGGDLIVSSWPQKQKKQIFKKEEKDFVLIQDIITKIRNLRAEYKVEPAKKVKVLLKGGEKLIKDQEEVVKALARCSELELVKCKPDKAASAVVGKVEIFLPLADLIDFDKEKARLEKEILEIEQYINSLEKKLTNKEFIKNAPAEIVAKEKEKGLEAKEKLQKLQQQLEEII